MAISENGNTCIVGANEFNGLAGAKSGVASVFSLLDDEWVLKGNMIEGQAGGDKAGTSVDISNNGDIIAVGAYLNDNSFGDSAGQVRIFEYDSIENEWNQLGNTLNGESSSDGFGASLALSGDGSTIGVGGPLSNVYYEGSVRVFHLSANKRWTQFGGNIYGTERNGNFGNQVALSSNGNIIGIGMLGDSGQTAKVHIYQVFNDSWTILGESIDGSSISLSNDGFTAAVANPTSEGGQVRVMHYSNGNWTQIGEGINSTTASTGKITSVAISGNGRIVAAGSISAPIGEVQIYRSGGQPMDGVLRSRPKPYFPSHATSSSSRSIIWNGVWTVKVLLFVAVNFYML